MAKKQPADQSALDQAPTAGGSYVRQPDTGELTKVSGTDEAADTQADPSAAPAVVTTTQE